MKYFMSDLKPNQWVAGLISIFCFILIVFHAIDPDFIVDSTSIYLIIIMIFPWLFPYFESISLPGGGEFKTREVKAAGEQVIKNYQEARKFDTPLFYYPT
jgi:hypothetical protein